jgi:hypothetical protein
MPGALVAVAFVYFPLHWVVLRMTWEGAFIQIPPDEAAALERALAPLAAAFAFVFGGAYIAPAKKLCMSIFLAVHLIVSTQVLFLSSERFEGFWSLHPLLMAWAPISQVIGAGLGVFGVIMKYRAEHPITRA